MEILNPLSPDVHSYPDDKYWIETLKYKRVGTITIDSGTKYWVAYANSVAGGNSNSGGPDRLLQTHQVSTAGVYSFAQTLAVMPDNPTALATNEGHVRRASCALEIIWTGRRDLLRGVITILTGPANQLYRDSSTMDTQAELLTFINAHTADPHCITVPVSSLLDAGGKITIFPRPTGHHADEFVANHYNVWSGSEDRLTNQRLNPWEWVTVIGQETQDNSFTLRWHEKNEVLLSQAHPMKGMMTGPIDPFAKYRKPNEPLNLTYSRCVAQVNGIDKDMCWRYMYKPLVKIG